MKVRNDIYSSFSFCCLILFNCCTSTLLSNHVTFDIQPHTPKADTQVCPTDLNLSTLHLDISKTPCCFLVVRHSSFNKTFLLVDLNYFFNTF